MGRRFRLYSLKLSPYVECKSKARNVNCRGLIPYERPLSLPCRRWVLMVGSRLIPAGRPMRAARPLPPVASAQLNDRCRTDTRQSAKTRDMASPRPKGSGFGREMEPCTKVRRPAFRVDQVSMAGRHLLTGGHCRAACRTRNTRTRSSAKS